MQNERDCWETPIPVYDKIDHLFNFDIDVCAGENNKKAGYHFSRSDDALSINWAFEAFYRWDLDIQTAWCNPPYSDVGPWLEKAIQEARINNITTVLLTNYIVDCAYFNQHINKYAEIWLAMKRIQFEPPGNIKASSNSKPQQVTVITHESVMFTGTPEVKLWDNR